MAQSTLDALAKLNSDIAAPCEHWRSQLQHLCAEGSLWAPETALLVWKHHVLSSWLTPEPKPKQHSDTIFARGLLQTWRHPQVFLYIFQQKALIPDSLSSSDSDVSSRSRSLAKPATANQPPQFKPSNLRAGRSRETEGFISSKETQAS